MNINEVKELLSQFDQSTLTEFDLREGSFELYMNKNNVSQKNHSAGAHTTVAAPEHSEAVAAVAPVPTQNGQGNSVSVPEKTVVASSDVNTEEIISPLVGVVYLQPAPDKDAFKAVGDKVKKGDVVCIVEAMKLMNEITATVDGTITEILVENEAVVEYNQPLFRVAKGE